jgi:hypothetical protein
MTHGFTKLPNGDVQLTMTTNDLHLLENLLGLALIACGALSSSDDQQNFLDLLDRLHRGDPDYQECLDGRIDIN